MLNFVRPAIAQAFNEYVWQVGKRRNGATDLQALDSFFWPLDVVDNWNRLYGKAGFYHFQCLLPVTILDKEGAGPLYQLLRLFATVGGGALAVMKTMGDFRNTKCPLAFSGPGATLALDIPANRETRAAVIQAHRLVLNWGGQIYLAKDALLTAEEYREMVPSLNQWDGVRERHNPLGRWQSDLSRRLKL